MTLLRVQRITNDDTDRSVTTKSGVNLCSTGGCTIQFDVTVQPCDGETCSASTDGIKDGSNLGDYGLFFQFTTVDQVETVRICLLYSTHTSCQNHVHNLNIHVLYMCILY